MRKLIRALVPAALLAYASTPVPEHHLSAADDDERATAERVAAQQLEQASDPNPDVQGNGCEPTGVCWTTVRNPAILREAQALRADAAHHRALSKELRAAEAKSCVGVSDADRDEGPFIHLGYILSVRPLYGRPPAPPVLRGAMVTFRPIWGLTADFLLRVVGCHLARSNALGNHLADVPNCPMTTPGTQASVEKTPEGFAVSLWSDDPASAQEILTRASLLLPQPGPPTSRRAPWPRRSSARRRRSSEGHAQAYWPDRSMHVLSTSGGLGTHCRPVQHPPSEHCPSNGTQPQTPPAQPPAEQQSASEEQAAPGREQQNAPQSIEPTQP